MTRPSLPERLLVGAHPRRTLALAGVHDDELRGPLWLRDRQGLFRWAGQPDDARSRVLRAAAALPAGAAIGGWAAAHLLGSSEFDGETATGKPVGVPLCLGRDQRCRRPGQELIWRSELLGEIVEVDGVPVTTPERTCFDLARRATDLRAAVTDVEAVLRSTPVDLSAVAAMASERARWLGRRQAAAALTHVVPGAESRRETALRLLWVLDAHLPAPEPNLEVFDLGGRFLGRVDLLDRDAALVGEYDGEHHAAAAQRAADEVRRERIEAAGLTVVRVTSPDLGEHRQRTVSRLRQAHRQGLQRDRSRDAWVARPRVERSVLGQHAG